MHKILAAVIFTTSSPSPTDISLCCQPKIFQGQIIQDDRSLHTNYAVGAGFAKQTTARNADGIAWGVPAPIAIIKAGEDAQRRALPSKLLLFVADHTNQNPCCSVKGGNLENAHGDKPALVDTTGSSVGRGNVIGVGSETSPYTDAYISGLYLDPDWSQKKYTGNPSQACIPVSYLTQGDTRGAAICMNYVGSEGAVEVEYTLAQKLEKGDQELVLRTARNATVYPGMRVYDGSFFLGVINHVADGPPLGGEPLGSLVRIRLAAPIPESLPVSSFVSKANPIITLKFTDISLHAMSQVPVGGTRIRVSSVPADIQPGMLLVDLDAQSVGPVSDETYQGSRRGGVLGIISGVTNDALILNAKPMTQGGVRYAGGSAYAVNTNQVDHLIVTIPITSGGIGVMYVGAQLRSYRGQVAVYGARADVPGWSNGGSAYAGDFTAQIENGCVNCGAFGMEFDINNHSSESAGNGIGAIAQSDSEYPLFAGFLVRNGEGGKGFDKAFASIGDQVGSYGFYDQDIAKFAGFDDNGKHGAGFNATGSYSAGPFVYAPANHNFATWFSVDADGGVNSGLGLQLGTVSGKSIRSSYEVPINGTVGPGSSGFLTPHGAFLPTAGVNHIVRPTSSTSVDANVLEFPNSARFQIGNIVSDASNLGAIPPGDRVLAIRLLARSVKVTLSAPIHAVVNIADNIVTALGPEQEIGSGYVLINNGRLKVDGLECADTTHNNRFIVDLTQMYQTFRSFESSQIVQTSEAASERIFLKAAASSQGNSVTVASTIGIEAGDKLADLSRPGVVPDNSVVSGVNLTTVFLSKLPRIQGGDSLAFTSPVKSLPPDIHFTTGRQPDGTPSILLSNTSSGDQAMTVNCSGIASYVAGY